MTMNHGYPRGNTCARAFAAGLSAHVDRVFCVAGESYLALLDALFDLSRVDVVTCRHEGSAAFMALADARLTGRAGVCIVNRGPGATNASIAVHSAAQDATPLVLVVGQVKTTDIGRQAFQEIDYAKAFSGLAKGVWVLHDARRVAEFTARAFRVAESGTPGPAVLVVPEDVLEQVVDAISAPADARWHEATSGPSEDALRRVSTLLAAARRPLIVAGGRLATPAGRRALRDVAERHLLPVVTSNKRQDVFVNTHPHYAGHLHVGTQPDQRRALADADLLLAVGTRLDHVTTQGYTVPSAPVPRQPLVHVYPDPECIGLVYRPTVGIACDPAAFLRALSPVAVGDRESEQRRAWIDRLHALEADTAAWRPRSAVDGVVFGSIVAALDELTGGDMILTIDAGNFTGWVHRHLRCTGSTRLLAVASSAMGFGVPSGVAAALRQPHRRVVTVVGDGGFQMTGSELATAVQRGARLVVIIANNGSYGTIRAHQERAFPGRTIATDLANPDFAALARAYGALGLTVRRAADIGPALGTALAHEGLAVVDVRTSLSWISPYEHLHQLDRCGALASEQRCAS